MPPIVSLWHRLLYWLRHKAPSHRRTFSGRLGAPLLGTSSPARIHRTLLGHNSQFDTLNRQNLKWSHWADVNSLKATGDRIHQSLTPNEDFLHIPRFGNLRLFVQLQVPSHVPPSPGLCREQFLGPAASSDIFSTSHTLDQQSSFHPTPSNKPAPLTNPLSNIGPEYEGSSPTGLPVANLLMFIIRQCCP